MTPYLDDGDVRLYHGDALEQLREMPSESVHCLVTSPPFWGLRSYIDDAHADKPLEHGLEETPELWCERLVVVFREARRVLRSDGVCWIEVGDTYARSGPNNAPGPTSKLGSGNDRLGDVGMYADVEWPVSRIPDGVKQKDLVGAPWLLAFALRADGWYLRSDTIWSRPNPMPESVTDRPTKAHSYVFLLTKSARYFYDADAIREPQTEATLARYAYSFNKVGAGQPAKERYTKGNGGDAGNLEPSAAGRNARSVWNIPTEPTPFKHFATFPQALVERCIKAGTSERGACSECGAPWRRITEHLAGDTEAHERPKRTAGMDSSTSTLSLSGNGSAEWAKRGGKRLELGWEPGCECVEVVSGDQFGTPVEMHADIKPCVVLDPFMGSGTTALVARRLGRHAWGVELNLEYLQISATRLQQLSLLA